MGSVLCEHCQTINSVTPIPNDAEGYFILDKDLSHFIDSHEHGYIPPETKHGIICRSCGKVTLGKEDSTD